MPSDTLERPVVRQSDLARRSILIVDDDDAAVDVLTMRLAKHGFQTSTTDSGRCAVGLAVSEQPSLILLDLRLPDADGFELCQTLVDHPATAGIPIIILSGMERPDIVRRCRQAGCQYFLRKPYDPSALLILIQQAIDEAAGL